MIAVKMLKVRGGVATRLMGAYRLIAFRTAEIG